MERLSSKIFNNNFTEAFPGDDSGSLQPRQTLGVLYSKALPTPVSQPVLLAWSEAMAQELDVQQPIEQDVDVLAGNLVTPSMVSYAACYGGHQFGNWAGQLGDGRAICLGEWQVPGGKTYEIQLKGAGPTAYSRRADGRAVLRSSVREYLMSEAMYYLGVPTTRALGLVATGDDVMRDMFYDGRPAYEPGAIVTRVAPSFLRFGNFEILAARNEIDNLRALANWTIDRYYPHLQGEDKVLNWFAELVDRTAGLMVEWLRVGFVHGVMNTDNMSILGLTIDYGPFSFLDNYDPDFTPNTTDLPGRRYAFGKQAAIAYWNLGRLANALAPLIPEREKLVQKLEAYSEIFWTKYYVMLANKLGLDTLKPDDVKLFAEWEKVLSDIQPDMTIFYQLLINLPVDIQHEQQVAQHFQDSLYDELTSGQSAALYKLISAYQTRKAKNTCSRDEAMMRMRNSNPRFILRNYLLHMAIEELEKGKNELFLKLQKAIKNPYSGGNDEFFEIRPGWAAQTAGCSMLSCSS